MVHVSDSAPARVGWFKGHKRTIAVAIVAICVGMAVLWCMDYRYHLWWLIQERRLGLRNVAPIPDRPMPEVVAPDSWVRCQVGGLEFSLPADLAANRAAHGEHGEVVTFQFGAKSVVVSEPTVVPKVFVLPSSGGSEIIGEWEHWTLPRLKLEGYRSGSGMFYWSMSKSQVRRYAAMMILRFIIRNGNELDSRVEYVASNDMDATMLLGKDRAVLDWESRRDAVGGYVHFIDREDNEDWNWVRIFCRSISVSHKAEAK